MDTPDIIAIAAAGVALVGAVAAVVAAFFTSKQAEAADASAIEAKRSADAAEEANRIAARALELSEPPAVAWRVEPVGGVSYNLRNVGTMDATGVTVDPSRFDGKPHWLPVDATIGAGEAVTIPLFHGGSTLFVKWSGQPEFVAVAVPPPAPKQERQLW